MTKDWDNPRPPKPALPRAGLTGRIRFRQSWTRSFVLQAEYTFLTVALRCWSAEAARREPYPVHDWRDATAADVAALTALGVLPAAESLQRAA